MVEGHGTTIDVVLVNGVLHEGDQIVVCGMQVRILCFILFLVPLEKDTSKHYAGLFVQGPIVTTIRALLTPHPMRELRVKVKLLLYYY